MKLGYRIPIASGEGRIQGFFNGRPGELSLTDAVGKINIKFVAMEVKLLAACVELPEIFAS